MSKQLEDFIIQIAGTHPLMLQVACFHACQSPGDLNSIESKSSLELVSYFKECWNNLSRAEREVLRGLDEAVLIENDNPALSILLRDLVRKCLIVRSGEGYRYPSKAWEKFVSAQLEFPEKLITK